MHNYFRLHIKKVCFILKGGNISGTLGYISSGLVMNAHWYPHEPIYMCAACGHITRLNI